MLLTLSSLPPLPASRCQELHRQRRSLFSQIPPIDQANRKPCLCLISAQLKPSAAVLKDREPQAFKHSRYIWLPNFDMKNLKISAFTPWGSAARLKDMKSLRIYSSFLWNAKNKAANAHKPRRQTLREGNAGTLKMEAQRDETCGISSAPAQAGRPHPVIMLYTTVSQSIIILLLKQLQINTEYLNVNSLSFFFFWLFIS